MCERLVLENKLHGTVLQKQARSLLSALSRIIPSDVIEVAMHGRKKKWGINSIVSQLLSPLPSSMEDSGLSETCDIIQTLVTHAAGHALSSEVRICSVTQEILIVAILFSGSVAFGLARQTQCLGRFWCRMCRFMFLLFFLYPLGYSLREKFL